MEYNSAFGVSGGSAFFFNPNLTLTTYMNFNTGAQLGLSLTGMTVAVWIYPTLIVGSSIAVGFNGAGTTTAPAGYVDIGPNVLYGHVSPTSGTLNNGSNPVTGYTVFGLSSPNSPLNAWTHLAAVFNGTAEQVYVNGNLFGTTSIPYGYAFAVNGFNLGPVSYTHLTLPTIYSV